MMEQAEEEISKGCSVESPKEQRPRWEDGSWDRS